MKDRQFLLLMSMWVDNSIKFVYTPRFTRIVFVPALRPNESKNVTGDEHKPKGIFVYFSGFFSLIALVFLLIILFGSQSGTTTIMYANMSAPNIAG